MDSSQGATSSPAIYIVASDGTRFAIPEQAAAFSSLLKGALDRWTREHAPPPPEEESEDSSSLDDSDATADTYEGETTPDRLDDDAATYTSSHTATHAEGLEERGLLPTSAAGGANGTSSRSGSASNTAYGGEGFTHFRRMISVDANALEDDDDDDDATPSDEEIMDAAVNAEGVSRLMERSPMAVAVAAPVGDDVSSDRTASELDMDSRGPSNASSYGTPSPHKGSRPPGTAAPTGSSPVQSSPTALFRSAHDGDDDGEAPIANGRDRGTATVAAGEAIQQTKSSCSPSNNSGGGGSQPRTPQIIDRDTATPSTLDEEEEEIRGVEQDGDLDNAHGHLSPHTSLGRSSAAPMSASPSLDRPADHASDGVAGSMAVRSGNQSSSSSSSSPTNSHSTSDANASGGHNAGTGTDDDDATPEELPLEVPIDGEADKHAGADGAGGGSPSERGSGGRSTSKKVKKGKKTEKNSTNGIVATATATATATGKGGKKGKKNASGNRKNSLKPADDDAEGGDSRSVVFSARETHADPSMPDAGSGALGGGPPSQTKGAATAGRGLAGNSSGASIGAGNSSTTTTIVVATEAANNDDDDDNLLEAALAAAQAEEDGTSNHMPSGSAVENSAEWISPTSVHQRTPVMLGDDDEVIIVRGDGQEETLTSFGRQSSPPPAPPSTPPPQQQQQLSPSPSPVSGKSTERGSLNSNNNNNNNATKSAAPGGEGDGEAVAAPADGGGTAFGELRGARITATEILIDLRASPYDGNGAASPPAADPTSPTTTAAAAPAANRKTNGSGGGQTSNSATLKATAATTHLCVNYLLHFTRASTDFDAAADDSYPRNHTTTTTTAGSEWSGTGNQRGNVNTNDESGGARSSSVVFSCTTGGASSSSAPNDDDGHPTVLQNPLPAPLISQLSPWEQHFLYITVLGYDEGILGSLQKILDQCPTMDYLNPGASLKDDDKTRKLLLVPPPPAMGMQTLRLVMAAAKELRVDSLYSLCCAWMADHMLRICYGATDNFEAAHLIRQSFHIQSDWARKETDCLKVENEWPANEEEC